jgi:DNA-binding NarL/FixJ family response regulator
VLLCFVYLSRFSLGIYLVPSAILILVAGIISIMNNSVPAIWEEQSRTDSPKLGEIIQTRRGQIDPRLRKLTPRELEVLLLIADGKSNQEIADALVISPNTVRHHVHHILRKLNCSSRGEAAVIAKISGLRASDKT